MDNEQEQVMVPADARITFIKKNNLSKVLRRVDKSTEKAISFLEGVMLNEDNDIKTRLQAATYLLDKRVAISESVSRDNLSRCVAESRLLLAQQAVQQKRIKDVVGEDDDEHSVPQYLPSVILDASMVKSM